MPIHREAAMGSDGRGAQSAWAASTAWLLMFLPSGQMLIEALCVQDRA